MTRFAILNPESLQGREIKDGLARRPDLYDDLRLLTSELEEGGVVTQVGDEAAFVLPATRENTADVDVLFACTENEVLEPLEGLPAEATTILVPGGAGVESEPVFVAGINDGVLRGMTVASAHPVVVALAHLLHPLVDLGLKGATTTAILPSSIFGQGGIDELLNQTRALLAFQTEPEQEHLEGQLAFNLVPGSASGSQLAANLAAVLGREPGDFEVQTLLGGVFHGLALSVHVRLDPKVDADSLVSALSESSWIDSGRDSQHLGPIDAAGKNDLLLGKIGPGAVPGSFWLWAVLDNLIAGAARNAIGLAEALGPPSGYEN